jgi:hypothetical protein
MAVKDAREFSGIQMSKITQIGQPVNTCPNSQVRTSLQERRERGTSQKTPNSAIIVKGSFDSWDNSCKEHTERSYRGFFVNAAAGHEGLLTEQTRGPPLQLTYTSPTLFFRNSIVCLAAISQSNSFDHSIAP